MVQHRVKSETNVVVANKVTQSLRRWRGLLEDPAEELFEDTVQLVEREWGSLPLLERIVQRMEHEQQVLKTALMPRSL